MAKKFIKKYMPNHETIRDHKYLRIFGRLLHNPNLWHFNRRSVSGAFAIGLFFAWIPVPFQMVLAAAVAIPTRMNLPLSVVLVWVTNPLTMPPMFYASYKLGSWLLNTQPINVQFSLEWEWLKTALSSPQLWEPFLLGSLIAAMISGALGYVVVRLLWRWQIIREWQERKKLRKSE